MYEYLTGRSAAGAHNAIFDVLALEAVLEAPGIKENWRVLGNKIQFVPNPNPNPNPNHTIAPTATAKISSSYKYKSSYYSKK
jgi:hypothetical protein